MIIVVVVATVEGMSAESTTYERVGLDDYSLYRLISLIIDFIEAARSIYRTSLEAVELYERYCCGKMSDLSEDIDEL